MPLNTEQKSQIVRDYQRDGADTGSPEVQVALLPAASTACSRTLVYTARIIIPAAAC